ncbi:MAG: histidine kinase [Candidatus Solibacter sp.]|nr:histidine kinase [Candidatus Solibacter sp.]
MSRDSELGSSFHGQAVFPLLLECDYGGQVRWMSRSTRAILHNPKQLLDILAVTKLRQPHHIDFSSLRFWVVSEFHDAVLIAAIGTIPVPETQDLSSLHRNLTGNFFRLLSVERRLFERARRRRGNRGKSAIQQIEMERRRLGRELHTGVGQVLAAISWQLEVISADLPEPSPQIQHALENMATLTAQALEQVRGVSQRLHPPEWQRLTLESALRQLWEISGIPERLEANLQLDPLPGEPDLEVKVLLYRAFQEALSNVARHSKATRIDACLVVSDVISGGVSGPEVTLSIADNGVGFDLGKLLATPANLTAGLGLRSIRETAESLGGKFEAESGPSGTKLVISVALSPVEQ